MLSKFIDFMEKRLALSLRSSKKVTYFKCPKCGSVIEASGLKEEKVYDFDKFNVPAPYKPRVLATYLVCPECDFRFYEEDLANYTFVEEIKDSETEEKRRELDKQLSEIAKQILENFGIKILEIQDDITETIYVLDDGRVQVDYSGFIKIQSEKAQELDKRIQTLAQEAGLQLSIATLLQFASK